MPGPSSFDSLGGDRRQLKLERVKKRQGRSARGLISSRIRIELYQIEVDSKRVHRIRLIHKRWRSHSERETRRQCQRFRRSCQHVNELPFVKPKLGSSES